MAPASSSNPRFDRAARRWPAEATAAAKEAEAFILFSSAAKNIFNAFYPQRRRFFGQRRVSPPNVLI